jgi:hypothetical protein
LARAIEFNGPKCNWCRLWNRIDTCWLYCFWTMRVFAPTNCRRRYLRSLCSAYQV